MGQTSGKDLSTVVHPDLKQSGSQASEAIASFGATVEALLIKHKKDIVRKSNLYFLSLFKHTYRSKYHEYIGIYSLNFPSIPHL